MKNYIEIKEEMKRTRESIEKAENGERGDLLRDLKIKNAILRDNARRAYAADVLPVVIEILKKYNGKAYGEKTKEKMNDELKAAKNCRFYISREYCRDELHLIPLNDEGYSGTIWRYDDFIFATGWNGATRLLNNNKINGGIAPDALTLQSCGEYVDDIPARVLDIVENFNKAQEAREAANTATRAYNKLLPSTGCREMDTLPTYAAWII